MRKKDASCDSRNLHKYFILRGEEKDENQPASPERHGAFGAVRGQVLQSCIKTSQTVIGKE